MLDVYSSLGSAQDSKCASSAILGKDFLTSSPPAYLGQAPGGGEKKFPTALVVGGLIVGGIVLYYASKVGGGLGLAANPSGDDRTYEVWQFSGKDGYGEASGLSWDEAVAQAEAIHARTGREVRVFDEEELANAPPSKLPKAKKVIKRARKANDSYSPFEEHLRGGRASGMRPENFDPAELARGTKHELEHTRDREIATEIAMDHLAEDEAYYQKLDAMERGAFRDNPGGFYLVDIGGDAFDQPTKRDAIASAKRMMREESISSRGGWHEADAVYVSYVSFDDDNDEASPIFLTWRDREEKVVSTSDLNTMIEVADALALRERGMNIPRGSLDNPWSKAGCVKDCHGTFGKNNKPAYLKKCLAACHGVLLGKGLADLPKGA